MLKNEQKIADQKSAKEFSFKSEKETSKQIDDSEVNILEILNHDEKNKNLK